MLKKTLLTAAAALAITTGATAIGATDANAGVKFKFKYGHGWQGFYSDFYDTDCVWKKKRVKVFFWHNGHKHKKWVWRSYKYCY